MHPLPPPAHPATTLFTDRYELTMLDAALRDGTAQRPCVFETFTRRLPPGRRYAVAAGLGRLTEAIAAFRPSDDQLAALDDGHVVSPATLAWLADYRFRGDVVAYREGEIVLPDSPVLTVVGTFAEAVVLETLALSVLNHDSAVASAAARMVAAAEGRSLLEFGSRRTHEHAAVAAARATYVVGFDGTSNLAAGARYDIPTLGTAAHAFTLLHDDEAAAFQAQVAAFGPSTTLLVDTFDTVEGVATALRIAGPGLGGVRIDSGKLATVAHQVRAQLDAAGATRTRIVASSDLDELVIADLRDAPIDSYGVGTSVVTGSGAPTAGFVYKRVARATTPGGQLEPVAKTNGEKSTVGGRKRAARRLVDGFATAEVLRPWTEAAPPGARELQVPVIVDGELVHDPNLTEIRAHHASAIAELPPAALDVLPGEPCIPTVHELLSFQEVPV